MVLHPLYEYHLEGLSSGSVHQKQCDLYLCISLFIDPVSKLLEEYYETKNRWINY